MGIFGNQLERRAWGVNQKLRLGESPVVIFLCCDLDFCVDLSRKHPRSRDARHSNVLLVVRQLLVTGGGIIAGTRKVKTASLLPASWSGAFIRFNLFAFIFNKGFKVYLVRLLVVAITPGDSTSSPFEEPVSMSLPRISSPFSVPSSSCLSPRSSGAGSWN